MRRNWWLGMLLLALPMATPAATGVFSAERAAFTIKVRQEICPYKVLGVYLLPGADLTIEVDKPAPGETFEVLADQGSARREARGRWVWTAPENTGLVAVQMRRVGSSDEILLNVFVMVPMNRLGGESLNGYRIGSYPDKPLRGLEIYKPPRGFIEVTPANQDTLVSPHFKLKQFLCKQAGDYPKYVVLRERLLLKLEQLLQMVNSQGLRTDSFVVMSGFRTPYYNAAIGNVRYSRHMWGGAADIFIDESPRDGVMDDLNGDGRVNGQDSAFLYDLIEKLYDKKIYERFRGGLGRYATNSSHGPFVHVDVRGFRARWGR